MRKTKLSGLVLNVKEGETVNIGEKISISAENLPGSKLDEITIVIQAPKEIIITREAYDLQRGVLDSVNIGKNLRRTTRQ